MLLWEVAGRPVALAVAQRQVAGMTRIGPVYTPPADRRHGFGAAVTAAAAAWALDDGAGQVVLFVDHANPTTNRLYHRLGFRPVHDAVELSFHPRGSVGGWASVGLELTGDPVELCAALVDMPSVSGDEAALADAVERALREQAPHLEVLRSGDAVLARTELGRERRVLLAGHLDTVPIADNLPSRRDGHLLHGCGTSDMKAGDAVIAHLAATVPEPRYDLTVVFYDCEEVEAARNGLGRIEREHADWLRADLAVLGEPTNGTVEAGCQGTLRVEITTSGRRAHSARSWLGDNAVHAAAPVLDRLTGYRPDRSTSTAAGTGRACRRCASPAGWPGTWCPTAAWSR